MHNETFNKCFAAAYCCCGLMRRSREEKPLGSLAIAHQHQMRSLTTPKPMIPTDKMVATQYLIYGARKQQQSSSRAHIGNQLQLVCLLCPLLHQQELFSHQDGGR